MDHSSVAELELGDKGQNLVAYLTIGRKVLKVKGLYERNLKL